MRLISGADHPLKIQSPKKVKFMSPQVVESVLKPAPRVEAVKNPENLERDLVQVFKLLADETRLRILMYLMKEPEINVTSLCERLGQSQPAVSHHLALLRVSGLIQPRRDGKHNFYSVRKERFHDIMGALFIAMKNEGSSAIKFEDFTLSQEG
jgi:ArsR family transcriptional regulator